ncbi:MAG: hypothetical protein UT63_C0058G0016 [Candidatus Gottesmanbacteria bacterium GW2011_GWC2_39_8]|uniref:Transcription regulator TrmB N-terminal domain-containing protein n=1 Tax=Candidatus Gottesmanbacteria bacterium GW2011_GWC2_39_8 TaxID=1618450 RepID=A0A0G0SAU7_9BACT|nr:MAG: hypothetical protein UT63_C0058G0016 [Candidatus Gottesmanbacteria bacterium GW2011_GWC2_39_8]
MKDLFHKLGLNEKESTAYLELVRLGTCPISKWAKHAKINRSSMYVMLDKFKNFGLLNTFTHNGITHVQAIRMAELTALINDKETEVARTRELFENYLPDLEKLEKTYGITPKVKFHEGKTRVDDMYEEVIKEKSFRSFVNLAKVKAIMPEYFHKIPLELKAQGGTAKELLVRCKEAEEYKKLYNSDKHIIALLPEKILFSSDTIITNQKIYLVGYSQDNVVATEIWNEELAQTQSVLFDLMWSSLKLK